MTDWPWLVVHVFILLWLVRIEMLLFRIKRMGDDVSLVESLLRCWATAGEWSPHVRAQLLHVLRQADAAGRRGWRPWRAR